MLDHELPQLVHYLHSTTIAESQEPSHPPELGETKSDLPRELPQLTSRFCQAQKWSSKARPTSLELPRSLTHPSRVHIVLSKDREARDSTRPYLNSSTFSTSSTAQHCDLAGATALNETQSNQEAHETLAELEAIDHDAEGLAEAFRGKGILMKDSDVLQRHNPVEVQLCDVRNDKHQYKITSLQASHNTAALTDQRSTITTTELPSLAATRLTVKGNEEEMEPRQRDSNWSRFDNAKVPKHTRAGEVVDAKRGDLVTEYEDENENSQDGSPIPEATSVYYPAQDPLPVTDNINPDLDSSSEDGVFAMDTLPIPVSTRTSTSSEDSMTFAKPDSHIQLENLLLSTSKVGKVCILFPRAGPFDGQLVALVTVTAISPSQVNEISLPPEVEYDSCRRHINALRTAVQEWGTEHPRPNVWIILHSMAMDDAGRPDSRRLQTWVQNINHDVELHVMNLQAVDPPRGAKGRKTTLSHRRRSTWPERLSKVWEEEEERIDPAQMDDDEAANDQDNDASGTAVDSAKNIEYFPLSPMQQLHFRTSMNRNQKVSSLSQPGFRFSQSVLLKMVGGVQLTDVEDAISKLTDRHSMLRARFRLTGEGWAQIIVPQSPSSYRFGHHNADNDGEILSLLELAQNSISVVNGPVFAAEYIRAGDGRQLLYLVAHHLVVDLKSWRVVLYDLDSLLRTGSLASEKSIPFPEWIDHQTYEAGQRSVKPILPFELHPADLKFWGMEEERNCYGDADSLGFYLSPDLTTVLQTTCNKVFRTETTDIFLAALLLSFCQAFPERPAPTLWKQEHGRDASHSEFNLEETVGWFTTLCPTQCAINSTFDFLHVLKVMKDTRRQIPRSGIPFFTSEFSATGSSGPFSMVPVEIMFNCIESPKEIHRKGGVLEPIAAPNKATNSLASDIGQDVGRIALVEVSVVIDRTGTNVEALYNRNSKHDNRIATWMGIFEHMLLDAIGRLRVMKPELTLADAPLLKTTYQGLSNLTNDRLKQLGIDSVSSIEAICPANPSQQEILVARGQDFDSFQVHGIYELITPEGGPADQGKLCSAWEALVDAHPALRSIFIDSISEKGLFDQIIFDKISPAMLFIDAENPEETLASLPSMRIMAVQPRHRLSICRASTRTFVRIDASQAICDPLSIHNLMHHLQLAYAGKPLNINDSLLPTYLYHVSSLDRSYSLGVWKVLLQESRPCNFPRLTIQTHDSLQSTSFGLEITRQEMVDFCERNKTDMVTLVQLAWALVLRIFVGMDRVTFGYLMEGRDEGLLPGIRDSVGSFATILPCSVNLTPVSTIKQSLASLQELGVTAKQHQVVIMPEIHNILEIYSENLFNTCLSFQDNKDLPAGDYSGSVQTSMVTSARTSDCDLSLSSTFCKEWLHANISFRHLSPNQAHNLVSTFEMAIRAILDSPPLRAVTEVDLFTDRDYAQLVVQDWESSKNKKINSTLHQVILDHAWNRPNAPAICSWDGDLTFRQMREHVMKLATLLVNLGVEPGMTIPIVLEKNKWAPVIMLGVLQAGGAFLGLDCQDKPMIESMIKQLDPPIVLATNASWKVVSILSLQPILVNDTLFSTLPHQIAEFDNEPSPDHGACIFFSPGRTKSGGSKSIFFTHSSLATAFNLQGPALKMDSSTRVLQLSAFNMDIALVETLGTLSHGGCVCIPSGLERTQDLTGAIHRTRASWSYMTSVLARRLNPAKVPSLKTLCFRTRSLDEDTYGPWLKGRDVLLAYGAPDVCPLGVSITDVSKSQESTIIPPPLMGKFWVLNPEDPRKLVPVGAIGELGIDCPLVTPHRYISDEPQIAPSRHQSDLERDRQRPRYLKTGHRVRYLDDGNIQFLSSMRDEIIIGDAPVCVADVEQLIRRSLGSNVDVCVEAVNTNDGVQVLCAFLEYGDRAFKGPSDFDELSITMKEQAFLARKTAETALSNPKRSTKLRTIPQQHIPSAYVPLKRFPISSSLKVNKRRLQKMVSNLSYSQLLDLSSVPNPAEVLQKHLKEKPLPLTQIEEIMRRIWAAVLEAPLENISANDSFMGVGGNKYRASHLVVECRQAGLAVSILDLLRGATLTDLCQTIAVADGSFVTGESQRDSYADNKRLSTQTTRLSGADEKFVRDIIAPQLGAQGGDIMDVAEASSMQVRNLEIAMYREKGHVSCLILNFNGPIRYQKLEVACEALTRVHPILRTAFVAHDRKTYQVLLESFKPAFQRFPCPAKRLESVSDHVIKQDLDLAFRLGEIVTRFSFFDAGGQGRLVIRLSSTQIDETSATTLVQDLISLYNDMRSVAGKPTFFDYMRSAQSSGAQNGIEYWNNQLEGAQMTQIVSHPKPYPIVSSIRTLKESVPVNPLTDYGMTFDTVLKAAWAVVLATLSGSADVLFGETIEATNITFHGDLDATAVVGPLANIIPVRVGFPASHSTPLDLMQYIRAQRQSSHPYEAMGILDIVQHCTKWTYWTRFSSVVQHRDHPLVDGTATLNMGNTTFRYELREAEARDVPSMLVTTVMNGARNVNVSLSYPTDRVPQSFADSAMKLLVSAIRMLTGYDSITKPLLPSSSEIVRCDVQIPLPAPDHFHAGEQRSGSYGELLSPDQRGAVQALVSAAWTEILDPAPLGVPEGQLHTASFYDLWGSLLPAYFFAEYLNRELSKLPIPLIEKVKLSPEDIVKNPNMISQFEFVARRLRELGFIAPSLSRKKTIGSTHGSSSIWAPTAVKRSSSPTSASLTWTRSLKKKSQGVRDLSNKASGWMRHRRGNLSKDSSQSQPDSQSLNTMNEGGANYSRNSFVGNSSLVNLSQNRGNASNSTSATNSGNASPHPWTQNNASGNMPPGATKAGPTSAPSRVSVDTARPHHRYSNYTANQSHNASIPVGVAELDTTTYNESNNDNNHQEYSQDAQESNDANTHLKPGLNGDTNGIGDGEIEHDPRDDHSSVGETAGEAFPIELPTGIEVARADRDDFGGIPSPLRMGGRQFEDALGGIDGAASPEEASYIPVGASMTPSISVAAVATESTPDAAGDESDSENESYFDPELLTNVMDKGKEISHDRVDREVVDESSNNKETSDVPSDSGDVDIYASHDDIVRTDEADNNEVSISSKEIETFNHNVDTEAKEVYANDKDVDPDEAKDVLGDELETVASKVEEMRVSKSEDRRKRAQSWVGKSVLDL